MGPTFSRETTQVVVLAVEVVAAKFKGKEKDKAVRLDEFHSQFAGQRLFQNIFVTVFLNWLRLSKFLATAPSRQGQL